MSIVTIANVRKEFIEDVPLFEDVSFAVNPGEKVALIGMNGSGKTTLLRMISGEVRPDSGSVSISSHATVGSLSQDPDLPDSESVLTAVSRVSQELRDTAIELAHLGDSLSDDGSEHPRQPDLQSRYADALGRFERLGGYEYERRASEMLRRLGFSPGELGKPVRVLSGGQKTRAGLARLLLCEPDLLLLDEPTNHLDIDACEWLQDFLSEYRGAALIVSHDRYFLDRVVTRVVSLEHGKAITFPGNYTQTAEKRAAFRQSHEKQYELEQREIERMEEMVTRFRVWAGSKGSSGKLWKQVFSKEKALERLRIQQIERPKSDPRAMRLALGSSLRGGNEVLEIRELRKQYSGYSHDANEHLINDDDHRGKHQFSLTVDHLIVRRSERVGMIGPNGSGKTTLLKVISGEEPETSGYVRLGGNIEPAYFAQSFSHLRSELTVLEEFVDETELTVKEARHRLARYRFTGEDVFKPVDVLSGGEKCRLALAKLLLRRPNLLLLDEPTNHLDIVSREVLEDALRDFEGTMLIASHDRYFLDALATRIVEIRDGKANTFDGSYSEFREQVRKQTAPENAIQRNQKHSKRSRSEVRKAQSDRQDRAVHRTRVRQLEEQISLLETQLSVVAAVLGNPDTYRRGDPASLTSEYAELSEKLNDLYREWDQLVETNEP